ncbi:expressed unknown protein [Seminavis robusta]|uniref:Uncharacterized protein n=1 Tax=Seminavis robusta TaxID=568900 RepID=A0A9N8DYZ2_9STRA|nr:expressed unknown protein [Seminavis robusta]|eukprot:Sro480_g151420.1 n/a (211) ;mRNA; f:41558-42190
MSSTQSNLFKAQDLSLAQPELRYFISDSAVDSSSNDDTAGTDPSQQSDYLGEASSRGIIVCHIGLSRTDSMSSLVSEISLPESLVEWQENESQSRFASSPAPDTSAHDAAPRRPSRGPTALLPSAPMSLDTSPRMPERRRCCTIPPNGTMRVRRTMRMALTKLRNSSASHSSGSGFALEGDVTNTSVGLPSQDKSPTFPLRMNSIASSAC